MNWHVVVRHSFIDVSGLLIAWCDKADKAIIVEHTPDSEDPRIHCHIGLFGIPGTYAAFKKNNPLRDMFKTYYPEIYRPKESSSWMDRTHREKNSIDLSGCLTYFLKGGDEEAARLKFLKNIPAQSVEAAKQLWVKHEPSETAKLNPSMRAWKECWEYINIKGITKDTPASQIASELNDLLNDIGYDFRASYRSGIINNVIATLKPAYKAEMVKRIIIPKPDFWGDEVW